MELTRERVEEIADHLLVARIQFAFITTEELVQTIHDIETKQAIGPMVDPTEWRNRGIFASSRSSAQVLRLIIQIKSLLEDNTDIVIPEQKRKED